MCVCCRLLGQFLLPAVLARAADAPHQGHPARQGPAPAGEQTAAALRLHLLPGRLRPLLLRRSAVGLMDGHSQ